MALELLTHYRKEISDLKLVPSGGGAFEVSVNGKLIFSKLEEGRFPEPKELKQSIDSA
jgi:selenoprotein W-related protein